MAWSAAFASTSPQIYRREAGTPAEAEAYAAQIAHIQSVPN